MAILPLQEGGGMTRPVLNVEDKLNSERNRRKRIEIGNQDFHMGNDVQDQASPLVGMKTFGVEQAFIDIVIVRLNRPAGPGLQPPVLI
jgi:hypothetical protein